ncbi:hypothetical protein AWC38_SpisGene22794 [Stylophora pistillata]|uniref:Uncharacterized protein n=1 Tax=Stylophora pistillata TaxID=50429 RepID=A0A2B4RA42_STYPI|nr:hypothetical protein AWC38_SpisGene22794 [Stylophora pistillata]
MKFFWDEMLAPPSFQEYFSHCMPPRTRAMDEVSVERLIKEYQDKGQMDNEDPALLMLKKWPSAKQFTENSDKLPGLEQLINRLLEILLESELNSDNRYEKVRDKEDKQKRTLLHYVAELGFLHVTKAIVKKCPGLLALKTIEPKRNRALLPVELALQKENDEVVAYLIRMMWHERAQKLFSWIPGNMEKPQPSFFSFKSVIENPKMKKTVMAMLDQMVNPHWPYLPQRKESYDTDEEEEGVEGAWNTITDDPLDYHLHYHILDGDEGGCPPCFKISGEHQPRDNEYFNWKDKSCLHLIAKSHNKEALQHPVVRMLIKTKWKNYGHLFLSLQAAFYVIFLFFLSCSLLHASTRKDATQYYDAADSLRGFCEIVTLLFVVLYVCEEVNQMRM